ncbi:MAG: response regulator [Planctomycetes bacterium]|nr:response regulator [Planctomycetota bacterium]
MAVPKTVFIVDDDPHILRLLTDLLTSEGFRVVTSESGEEAVRTLSGTVEVDLIILDIMLPGSDGYGVLRWIRDSPLKDRPVIFLTAKAQDVDLLRGYGSGGDHYITKPFHLKTLLRAIRYFMGEEPTEARLA